MGQSVSRKKLSQKDLDMVTKNTAFSPSEIEDLYQCFVKLDKDHSGELDRKEFRSLWKTKFAIKGVGSAQIDNYFDAFDTDGSGTISFTEFASALGVLGPGSKEEKLRYIFKVYDEDKNGVLTANELDNIVQQMYLVSFAAGRTTEKDSKFISALVKKLDVNGDGVVSLDEWITVGSKTPSILVFLGIIQSEDSKYKYYYY